MNVENKKIWDEIFQKQPPVNNDDDCCVMCERENGEYVPATPLGFDDEQKTFDALKEIIETAIKVKKYKTWHIGSGLVETYTEDKSPIEEFDVVYLFSKSWEEPLFPVLVKEITDKVIKVQWIGGKENEDIINKEIPYKQ